MANNDVNNKKKLNNAFNVCRYIAVIFGVVLLSTWTVKSAPSVNSTKQVLQQNLYKEITGIVKTEQGDPIPGTVVLKVGTNQGTDTDVEGKYNLNANEGDKIQFVYEGFKTTTVTVSKSNILNITLVEDKDVLSDIVSDEYRTVSKEDGIKYGITSREFESGYPSRWYREMLALNANSQHLNILTQIKTKTVTTTPKIGCGYSRRHSFAQILKPLIPTITYTPEINRNPEVILKDVEALTRNGNYTYIVDGVRVSEETFRSLNQNDIESVDIYKHTDVYNARFGNKDNQSRITLEAR